jgi:DNA polymerase III subunit gamma/tau
VPQECLAQSEPVKRPERKQARTGARPFDLLRKPFVSERPCVPITRNSERQFLRQRQRRLEEPGTEDREERQGRHFPKHRLSRSARMTYASLYQKYRPQTFEELVGQPHVATTLAAAVERGHLFHAYLFSGPRGTGKTSTARILAKAINCEKGPTARPCGKCQACVEIAAGIFPDVLEIDAATHSKVEETRDFLSNVPTGLSALARKRFYIVDEVHMLSTHAFNALLKTLEEPPAHVVFVLATTEPHKVPPTIAGRCQHFEFRLVSASDLVAHYKSICDKERFSYDDEALRRIASLARGSVRDGLSILDQLVAATGGNITKDAVDSVIGQDTPDLALRLARAIATFNLEDAISVSIEAGEAGHDYRAFAQAFAAVLRELLLIAYLTPRQAAAVAGVDPDRVEELTGIAKILGRPGILRCLDIMGEALAAMASGSLAQIALEMAIVRMCRPEDSPDPVEMSRKIDTLSYKLNALEGKLRGLSEISERLPAGSPAAVESPEIHDSESGRAASGPDLSEGSASGIAAPSGMSGMPTETETPLAQGQPLSPDEVLERWERFLATLLDRKRPREQAIYREAVELELQDNTLVVGFPKSHEFHINQAKKLQGRVSEILEEVFGIPLRLQIEAVDGPVSPRSRSAPVVRTALGSTSDVSPKDPGGALAAPEDTNAGGKGLTARADPTIAEHPADKEEPKEEPSDKEVPSDRDDTSVKEGSGERVFHERGFHKDEAYQEQPSAEPEQSAGDAEPTAIPEGRSTPDSGPAAFHEKPHTGAEGNDADRSEEPEASYPMPSVGETEEAPESEVGTQDALSVEDKLVQAISTTLGGKEITNEMPDS